MADLIVFLFFLDAILGAALLSYYVIRAEQRIAEQTRDGE